ncbi:pilus assembly protein N-terminal domain-containing protein, partial [Photobacterium nomapromontoriensis]|uniref:pilus assembly protein N-terminal domain-containing protein n=1 Tax=Photobacterium nomapromontoriensis TaxID=2910237 RepID=UPI003D0C9324
MGGWWPMSGVAADRYITLNDAKHFSIGQPISKVFISAPDIADYQVIDEQSLVVFAQQVGQTRLIVYGINGNVLLSERILVDIDLSLIRRQLKLHFPQLDIKLESVGEQVSVSGQVASEQQRDDVYRMVATLLNRESTERYEESSKLTFADSGLEESESLIFARNNRWTGIIENLVVTAVQQVNVKISVAQVTESFANAIGVDWGSLGAGV